MYVIASRFSRDAVSILLVLFAGLVWLSPAFASQIVVVQPVIAGPTGSATPNIARDLSFAFDIYAETSIVIEFLPTEMDTSLSSNLVENNSGYLPYFADALYDVAPIVTVYYVASIDSNPSNRGASACFGSFCAVWVSNTAANDTLAHELAHLLTGFQALWDPNSSDPSHSTDPTNLLASGDIRNIPSTLSDITAPGSTFDRIQPIQATAMQTSAYVQSAVPEPDSAVFLASGSLLLVLSRRLRRTG